MPGAVEVGGDGQLARKHVHCAQRQHAQAHTVESIRRIADPVENFIERTIAPGGNDDFEPFSHSLDREPARVPGGRRQFERGLGSDLVQVAAEAFGFFASRRGIENDASSHYSFLGRAGRASRGEMRSVSLALS